MLIKSKFLTYLFLSILVNSQVTATDLKPEQLLKVQHIIGDLIETTHMSLNLSDLQLNYYSIDDPEYFFVSNFGVARLLLGKNHYKIGINPIIFDNDISDIALKGVLAHELRHTEDYISGSILPIGLQIIKKKSRIQYERKTDLKVVMKGLDKELIAYKEWQYPLLSKEKLKTKRLEYLTPEEIRLIVEYKEQFPEMIETWLNNQIPLNIIDLTLDIKKSREQLKINYLLAKIGRKSRHSIRRGFNNKKLYLTIESEEFHFESCLLDIYFKGKDNQYYFNKKITLKIKSLHSNKPFKYSFNAKKKYVSADFRLYHCKDMEGEGIYFGASE
jgi:hypothetical protein